MRNNTTIGRFFYNLFRYADDAAADEEDEEDEEEDEEEGDFYIVLHDFEAQEAGDLAVKAGEIVDIISRR